MVLIERFKVSMHLVDLSKSSMMALTNMTTFGVAVETIVLDVEVEFEDRY